MAISNELFKRRQRRNRAKLRRVGGGQPRLSVFRSGRHIYAQVIDDREGFIDMKFSKIPKDLQALLHVFPLNMEKAALKTDFQP